MEFKHNRASNKDVVAYLDWAGELVLKNTSGGGYCLGKGGLLRGVCEWAPDKHSVNVRFYKGDEITLKF